MSALATILKKRRKKLGLTLAQVADAVGVTEATVQRWESGNIKNVRYKKLEPLAALLGVSPSALMGWPETAVQTPSNAIPVPEMTSVPLVGRISCGTPILAEQNIESYVDAPGEIRADFALVCKGDSMVGAGIEDGDVVYIRQQPEVENNEIAAVMIDGEATLKYFKRVGDMVLLSPANREYEPIIVSGENLGKVKIVGKAVGFTRFLEK